jgi:hypothetical protein
MIHYLPENVQLRLFQISELLPHTAHIACCHYGVTREHTLLAAGFMGQKMVFVSFVAHDFTGTGNFETTFNAAMRFHLRHWNVPPVSGSVWEPKS